MRLSTLLYVCLSLTTAIASPDGNQNSVNWSSLHHAMYDILQTTLPTKSKSKSKANKKKS